jgi:hypothetical protein
MGKCLPSICKALHSIPQHYLKKMVKKISGINVTQPSHSRKA